MKFHKWVVSLSLLLLAFAVNAETVWIDVRSQAEFDAGHLDDTHHIPHTEIADRITALNLEKDTPIRLFCRSGGRAGVAEKALKELGYTDVENVGGIDNAKKVREANE